MTITTMEELERVPVGDAVSINDVAWERVAEGLRRNDYVIDLASLAGDIPRSTVRRGVTPQANQLWTETRPRYRYLLIQQNPEQGGVWHAMQFYTDGSIVGLTQIRPDGMRFSTERPDWLNITVEALARTCFNHSQEATRYSNETASARTEALRLRQQVAEMDTTAALREFKQELSEHLQHLLDESEYDLSEVADWLENRGVRLPTVNETVEVTVEVTGHTQVYMDTDDGRRYAPDGVSVSNVDSFEVDWDYSFVLNREVSEGGCACGAVSRTDVEEYLREHDISYSRFDHEVECRNC